MSTATKLDPRCCTSGCPRCPFDGARELRIARAVRAFLNQPQPPSAWCDRCVATCYVDADGRCIPCGERVEGGGE